MKTVERGAALLDKRLPGWDREIDVDNLNLSDPCGCVLGQLFGDYDKGMRVLGIHEGRGLGFYRWPTGSWWTLSRAWRTLIRQRREGRAV